MTYKAKLKELEELAQKNLVYRNQLIYKISLLSFLEHLEYLVDEKQQIEFRFYDKDNNHRTYTIPAHHILISPSQESGLD